MAYKPPISKEPPDLPKPRKSAAASAKDTLYEIRQRNYERWRETNRWRLLVGLGDALPDDELINNAAPSQEPLRPFRQDLKAMKEDLQASIQDLIKQSVELHSDIEEHENMALKDGYNPRTDHYMAAKKAGAREPNRHRPDVPPGVNRPQAIRTALPPVPEPENPSYRGGLAEEYMKLKKENEALKNKLVQRELAEIHTGLSAELAAIDKKNQPFFTRFFNWIKSLLGV